jgi:hypothetical protein
MDEGQQPAWAPTCPRSGGDAQPASHQVGAGMGVSSNTPSANSSYGPGGEDTIYLACGVEWRESEALWAMLDELKQEAKRTGEPARKAFLGFALYVFPHGQSGKGGGPNFTYVADTGWARLGFLKMAKPKETTANLYVKVGSQACLLMGGAVGVRLHLRQICDRLGLGGELVSAKLSRVDLCVDVPGDLVTPLMDRSRHITRASKWADYGEGLTPTGFTRGSGSSIMLRVYRKDLKCDPELWDLLQEHRFGRVEPETFHEAVSRFEYQIRREQLREMGVDSLDDYIAKRASIWKYLTEDYFRVADGEVDRTNTTREEISEVWQQVCEAGRKAFGGAAQAARRVARHAYDATANGAQAVGNAIAKLVAAGAHVGDAADLVEKVCWAVAETIERAPQKWLEKFRRKDQWARDRIPRIVEFQ